MFWKKKQLDKPVSVLLLKSLWELDVAEINTENYTQIYTNHHLVNVCTRAIAEDLAALPLRVYDEKGNELNFSAFRRPNKYQSFSELIRDTLSYLILSGNAFWYVIANNSDIKRILLIPSGIVTIKYNKEQDKIEYIYTTTAGRQEKFADEEIFHFKTYNPESPFCGLSILQSLRRSLELNLHTTTLIKSIMRYDTTPPAVLETEQPLSAADAERVRDMWENAQRKKGRIAVLPFGLKFKAININPKDIEFLNTYKITREDILMAFGVPPVRVGLLEHASYANAYQQMELYVNNTLRAYASLLSNTIETNYYQLTGKTIKCEFDFSRHPVFVEALDRKTEIAKRLFEMGYPVNILRDVLFPELPRIPWGNVGYIKPVWLPAGELKENKKSFAVKSLPGQDLILEEKAYFLRIHQRYEEEIRRKIYRRLQEDNEYIAKKLADMWGLKQEKSFTKDDLWIQLELDNLVKMWTMLYEDLLFYVEEEEAQREIARHRLQIKFDLDTRFVEDTAHLWGLQTTEATLNMLIKEIKRGFDEGETISEIQKRIVEKFDEFSWVRALRIARTTTTRGLNHARLSVYKQSNIAYKQWLTALDEVVRETHQELDGQTVPVWDKFTIPSTGAQADAPGLFHIASEDINCRCTIVPVKKI